MTKRLIPFLIVFSTMLARPSFLGQYTTPLALALMLGTVVLASVVERRFVQFGLRQILIMLAFFAYWGFRLYQGQLWQNEIRNGEILKSAIVELVSLVFFLWAFSDEERSETAVRYFSVFVAVAGMSSFVSLLLSRAGLSEKISYMHLLRDPRDPDGMVYVLQFPFSVSYGELLSVSRQVLYRYSSGFAEAGIYPAFSFWVILHQVTTGRIKIWIVLGCLLGSIASFSTAALVCAGVAGTVAALWFVLCKIRVTMGLRISLLFIPVLFACAGVLFLLYAPDLGMKDKELGQKKSVSDRSENIERGIKSLPQNFLGRDATRDSEHGGICLLAETYGLGVVGCILWLVKMGLLCLWRKDNWFLVLVCSAPLFVTMAVSQPLYDYCPGVLFVLIAWAGYRKLDQHNAEIYGHDRVADSAPARSL